VPEERYLEVVNSEYQDLRKNAEVKGFRRGKVPLSILKGFFRGKVESEAARKLIEETLEPTLKEKNIKPVSIISVDPQTVESGKPFTYTAEVEVPPDIQINDYKGMKLKKVVHRVTEQDVDKRIEELREQNARLTPIPETRGAQSGDLILVNISATFEGKEVRELTVTDYHLELGRDFYLPDFDSRLYGMKEGEVREFTVEFPQDFVRANLQGKTVDFEVALDDAKERVWPELDDDFAKDLGKFDTLEDLREEVRKDLTSVYEDRAINAMRDQIIDHLIEQHSFEIPESMVEAQIDNIVEASLLRFVRAGLDRERLRTAAKPYREKARPDAERQVRSGLILGAIGNQEGLEIAPEEMQEGVVKRASQVDMSPDEYKKALEAGDRLEAFVVSLLEEKVFEFIEANAEITEEEATEESETDAAE
jgi:trigger factor